MKYFTVFILASFLVGCIESKKLDYKGVPRNSICASALEADYDVDMVACYHNFIHPKFKKGQRVYVKDSEFDSLCQSVVSGLGWNPVKNIPYYYLDIKCPNSQKFDAEIEEINLRAKIK